MADHFDKLRSMWGGDANDPLGHFEKHVGKEKRPPTAESASDYLLRQAQAGEATANPGGVPRTSVIPFRPRPNRAMLLGALALAIVSMTFSLYQFSMMNRMEAKLTLMQKQMTDAGLDPQAMLGMSEPPADKPSANEHAKITTPGE